MDTTTDERQPTIHAGCGRRHRPLTPCPPAEEDHQDDR